MSPLRNLFAGLNQGQGETFDTLAESADVRVERIVSRGAANPEGFWYDQETDEWVLPARGEATLEFENGEVVEMKAGDHLMIARHAKHRVQRTSANAIWVAVHWKGEDRAT